MPSNKYIHQLKGWPSLIWDQAELTDQLALVRHQQGKLIGRMQSLGFTLQDEASLSTLTDDVVKTSQIEGENLNRDQVRLPMIPMNPAYLLYYVPVVLAVSCVLAATRFEQPQLIWRNWVHHMIWTTVFMLVVAVLMQIAMWLI